MIRKIFKIGQSMAIVIPSSLIKLKRLEVGDYVEIKDDHVKKL